MKIYNSENWFYKLGLVGFDRIIKFNRDFHDLDIRSYNYSVNDDFIEFDISLLNDFATYYYNYFINEYNAFNSFDKKLNKLISLARSKDNFKPRLKDIKSLLSNLNKKIEKFNVNEFDECKMIEKIIGDFKFEEFEEFEKVVNRYKEIISSDNINLRLSVNSFKNILKHNFFGQVSFLNVSNSKKTIEEQKSTLFDNYVKPVIDAYKFKKVIGHNDEELLFKFIKDKEKENLELNLSVNEVDKLLKVFNKDLFGKKKKVKSIEEKLNTINKCKICDENLSFGSNYSDGSFIPLAISNENATNMFWNFNDKFPICPLCRLILFCTPAGTTKVFKKYMSDEVKYSDKLYYGFVSIEGKLDELINQNNHFFNISKNDGFFETYLVDFVKQSKKISEWQLQNILYIEFNSDYDSKNSKLNYFNMPVYIARFLKNNYEMLENIKSSSERMKCFDSILKRNDLKHIVDLKIRSMLKGDVYALNDSMNLIKIRNYINQYKKGCRIVDSSAKKLIDAVYFKGMDIAKIYRSRNIENQLTGISYKLLNAAKSDNKEGFLDVILRIYISIGEDIPRIFLDVKKEEKLSFSEIAHSFIIGLNSKSKYSNKEE